MEVNISLDVWSAMPDSRRRIDPAEEQGIAAQEERKAGGTHSPAHRPNVCLAPPCSDEPHSEAAHAKQCDER